MSKEWDWDEVKDILSPLSEEARWTTYLMIGGVISDEELEELDRIAVEIGMFEAKPTGDTEL